MKSYKDFRNQISEAKSDHIEHKEGTAAKLRNHINKHYEGKNHPSMGSNPYQSVQKLSTSIKRKHVDRLHTHLKNSGWEENSSGFTDNRSRRYSKGKNKIDVHHDGHVVTYGPKKAKRITTPYYD